MNALSSRAGIVTIALLSVLTASLAVVVAVDSGGGPVTAASSTTNRTISVSGVGTVQGKPDTLIANLGVHTHQGSVQDAINAIASDEHQLVSTLNKKGVSFKDIQTTDLQLNQSYDNHGNINGYDASESITVRIHPLDAVGKILAAASTSAGNDVTIDGLSFDIAHDAAFMDAARKMAFAQAKAAAETDASQANERLGSVISIKETQAETEPPPPYYATDALAAGAAEKSISISPGRSPVTVTLDVVWSLG